MINIGNKESPDEQTQQGIYDDYYSDEFNQKMISDKKFFNRILDGRTRKQEIHNLVFNETSKDAQKTYKNPGNVRAYGVVKNSNKWFNDRVLDSALRVPNEHNLKSKFPEKYDVLSPRLKSFKSIGSRFIDNFRKSGKRTLVYEVRNNKGRYVTWKVVGKYEGEKFIQKDVGIDKKDLGSIIKLENKRTETPKAS